MITCLLALSLLAEKPKPSFIDYNKPIEPHSLYVQRCDGKADNEKLATIDEETGALTLEKGVTWKRLAQVAIWSLAQRDPCTGERAKTFWPTLKGGDK